MVNELLERIKDMGVKVSTEFDCLVLEYGNKRWIQNMNGYNEMYQLKMIFDSPVMEEFFW